jgi:MFS family permease
VLGAALYAAASIFAGWKSMGLFVAGFCVIASMYGGGFATIPAYLADMFGTQFVGAIHGRLLTAWSTAGILGPVIVNYMHDVRLEVGVPFDQIYGSIFYVLAGMLVIGFVANLLVRPVAQKWLMTDAELEAERKLAHDAAARNAASGNADAVSGQGSSYGLVTVAWLFVGIPLVYGIWNTVTKAIVLFN